MSTTGMPLRGVVRGATIELDRPLGLPDGQVVSVVVSPEATTEAERLARVMSAFGAWAEDGEELDEYIRTMRDGPERPEIEP